MLFTIVFLIILLIAFIWAVFSIRQTIDRGTLSATDQCAAQIRWEKHRSKSGNQDFHETIIDNIKNRWNVHSYEGDITPATALVYIRQALRSRLWLQLTVPDIMLCINACNFSAETKQEIHRELSSGCPNIRYELESYCIGKFYVDGARYSMRSDLASSQLREFMTARPDRYSESPDDRTTFVQFRAGLLST